MESLQQYIAVQAQRLHISYTFNEEWSPMLIVWTVP